MPSERLCEIGKGFRFGMMLQLSVGPVCLYVFTAAGSGGLFRGLTAVAAAALVDACYILLSGSFVAALLRLKVVRRLLPWAGAAILVFFGARMIAGAFRPLPAAGCLPAPAAAGDVFWHSLAITGANPLTILFWSGVFASAVASGHRGRMAVFLFGSGCVLSTAVFLSAVSAAGALSGRFLPAGAVSLLNASVGLALVVFGALLPFRSRKQ